ncbi:MAG: arsenite methyltransferase [Actinomycetota bacterium]
MSNEQEIREEVRQWYARAAQSVAEPQGCGSGCGCGEDQSAPTTFGAGLYEEAERADLPEAAVQASLGCGNPTAVAELNQGDTVLDLGSGGGIDALLAARRVGRKGKVYGLDMTEEMLALALRNREDAGAENVEFLKGYIEEIPLPASIIDVVVSNCVINLSADKPRVFAEIFRVLKPGGRIGVSDVVSSNDLSTEDRATLGSHVGCIAGALSFAEYEANLADAGFTGIEITPTHEVIEGMFSAIIKATKPEGARAKLDLLSENSQHTCC